MLKLVNIKKDYKVADTKVQALKGISVTFRNSEFVSILGPSGCGKTTLLNIIGGLDKYSSGKLYVDEIATNKFNDSDWDTYRNHRIGFVFQSYNLIPHQTILENVSGSIFNFWQIWITASKDAPPIPRDKIVIRVLYGMFASFENCRRLG